MSLDDLEPPTKEEKGNLLQSLGNIRINSKN